MPQPFEILKGELQSLMRFICTVFIAMYVVRSRGVMVSTLDFESKDPSSSLGGTSSFFFSSLANAMHINYLSFFSFYSILTLQVQRERFSKKDS